MTKNKTSKKSKLGYVGIGVVVIFTALLLIGLYSQAISNEPYRIMRNSGMSPTINEGEIIEISKGIPFTSIVEGDVIAFYGEGYDTTIVQRVVEIVEDEPRQVNTQGDNLSKSLSLDSTVTEERFIGKIVKIYPDLDYAERNLGGRTP